MSIAKSIGIGVESGYRLKQELEALYDKLLRKLEFNKTDLFTYKFYMLRTLEHLIYVEQVDRYTKLNHQTKSEFVQSEFESFAKYYAKDDDFKWSNISLKRETFKEYNDTEINADYCMV